MIFCDLVHGYQPFNNENPPKWVKKNLKDVFLPNSLSIKNGLVKRGVQIQGWTIESWLNSSSRIKRLAKSFLNNLRRAQQKNFLEIGSSAYTHSILPLLSKDLIKAEIILDREIVEKYIGQPTWFWPPEGAVNKKVLEAVAETFPDLIVLLPDKALKKKFNGSIKIKFGQKTQKALVFSTLFKDFFMNTEPYQSKAKYKRRPKHLPSEMVWAETRRASYSLPVFQKVLDFLKRELKTDSLILMRDWENAGSKRALQKKAEIKEVRHFLKLKNQLDFYLPAQFNWTKAKIYSLSQIYPASWDIESTPQDPFPWWRPNPKGSVWKKRTNLKRKKIIQWLKIIKDFDKNFQKAVREKGGLRKALKNENFKKTLKQSLPAIHSCVGWHYFARRSWNNYRFAEKQTKEIVLPCLEKIKTLK